jgi:hypothetical protein
MDKDELFPEQPSLPVFRIGAFTIGGARDLIKNRSWEAALGGDITVYSKASALDKAYGKNPISFQFFLRLRPALMHPR